MSADAQPLGQEHRPQNPNSLANLRPPWQPGETPNPGGVRKGQVFVGERIKYLITLTPDELDSFEPATVADEIALARVKNARSEKRKGLAEAQMVTDRTEGKAKQPVEMSGQISVTTDLIIAYHTQINAMIVAEPGGDACCSCGATPAQLEAVRTLALSGEEFAKRLSEPASPQA